jgi:hypothetical protein
VAIVLAVMAVGGVPISAWQARRWVSGEVARVRTSVRAAEPTLDCTVGSDGGAGSGRSGDAYVSLPMMFLTIEQLIGFCGRHIEPVRMGYSADTNTFRNSSRAS